MDNARDSACILHANRYKSSRAERTEFCVTDKQSLAPV
jgi:hypothetical protein